MVKDLLEKEKSFKLGRNVWRESSMSEAEQESRTKMKAASRLWLTAKWKVLDCKKLKVN